jgi:hypothetical protein
VVSVRHFRARSWLIAFSVLVWRPGACTADPTAPPAYRFETYIGADYDGRAASLTTSTVWSVSGPVSEPGFRIKLDGLADIYGNTNASVLSSSFQAADLKGLGAIMAGYQFQLGQFWLKLYAGAAYEAKAAVIWDVGQVLQTSNWGASAAFEGYWQLDERIWSSLSISWLQPDQSGTIYEKAGYDIYKDKDWRIAAGAEAGFTLGNADSFKEGKALNDYNTYSRAGALLNFHYGANEITLSGGFSRASNEDALRPYATVRYGRQF